MHIMFWAPENPKVREIAEAALNKGLGIKPPFDDMESQLLSIDGKVFDSLCGSLQGEVFHKVMNRLSGLEKLNEWMSKQGPLNDPAYPNDYFTPMMMDRLGVLEHRRQQAGSDINDGRERFVESLRENTPLLEDYRNRVMEALGREVENVLDAEVQKFTKSSAPVSSLTSAFDISAAAREVIKTAFNIDPQHPDENPIGLTHADLLDYGEQQNASASNKLNVLCNVKYLIACRLFQKMDAFWTPEFDFITGCKKDIRQQLVKCMGLPYMSLDNVPGLEDKLSGDALADKLEELERQGVHIYPGSHEELSELHQIAKPDIDMLMDRLDEALDRLVSHIDPLALYVQQKRKDKNIKR